LRVDFAAGHLNFPSRPRARAQPKRNASTLNLTSPAYPSPSPSPSPNVALSWMRSARPARFFCNTRTYFSGGRPSPPHRPFLTFFSKTSVRPTSVRALVCSVVVRFFLLLGGLLRPRGASWEAVSVQTPVETCTKREDSGVTQGSSSTLLTVVACLTLHKGHYSPVLTAPQHPWGHLAEESRL